MKKILLLLLLVACSNNLASMKELRFNQQAPYQLNVGSVEIVNLNSDKDQITIDLPIWPDNSLKTWVNDRIKSASENKSKFKVIINKAYIKESTIYKKSKLEEDQKLYAISFDVKFELYDEDPVFPSSELSLTISRSKSIADNQSINDKKLLCYNLIADALKDLDGKFNDNFSNYFNNIHIIE